MPSDYVKYINDNDIIRIDFSKLASYFGIEYEDPIDPWLTDDIPELEQYAKKNH